MGALVRIYYKHSCRLIYVSLYVILFSNSSVANYSSIFSFEDAFKCNARFPHYSFCKAVVFKPWLESEKTEVQDIINSLPQEKLQHFFEVIQKKGITRFHRVTHASTWRNILSERRIEFLRRHDKVIVWVDPVTNVVGFMDAFFKKRPIVDPYTGIDRKRFVVLHELAHVFDLTHSFSSKEKFKTLLGWVFTDGNWGPVGTSSNTLKSQFDEVLNLISSHAGMQGAYVLDRKLGREYGYPSLYSMLKSQEAFAEILAYTVLDSTSGDYLSKNKMTYMESLLRSSLR